MISGGVPLVLYIEALYMKNYIGRGARANYKNTTVAAIPSGTMLIYGANIAVAVANIPVNATGVIHLEGVFSLPKAVGVSFGPGADLFRNASGELTTLAGAVYAGLCVDAETVASGATTCLCKIGY